VRVKYRYVFPWTEARGAELRTLGLQVEPPGPPPAIPVGVCSLEEGHAGWSNASQLMRAWGGSPSVSTEFSLEEILTAKYCVMRGAHFNGYPQPEDSYADNTYVGKCPECGTSEGQKAPFRIRKSLKWGRNDFLQLFWVVDEYFMKDDAFESFLAPLGVRGMMVEASNGQPLSGVVQLKVSDRVELDMGDAPGKVCAVCCRTRYSSHVRGFRPRPRGQPDFPVFRSSQFFGSGGKAFNEIVVRQEVVAAIKGAGLRGVEFFPCA